MDNQTYRQLMKSRLQNFFDFREDILFAGVELDFHARMHRRNEKYLLTKKNVLYAYDNFEYFSLYQKEIMTLSELQALMERFAVASMKITKPDSEHMSTDHVLIVRLNETDEECKEFVRKYKFRNYFRFGLQGACRVGIILVMDDAKSAVFSKDLRDKKYHFVLEK